MATFTDSPRRIPPGAIERAERQLRDALAELDRAISNELALRYAVAYARSAMRGALETLRGED